MAAFVTGRNQAAIAAAVRSFYFEGARQAPSGTVAYEGQVTATAVRYNLALAASYRSSHRLDRGSWALIELFEAAWYSPRQPPFRDPVSTLHVPKEAVAATLNREIRLQIASACAAPPEGDGCFMNRA
jgi:hypothetical protein